MTEILHLKMARACEDEIKTMYRFVRQIEMIEAYPFCIYTPEEFKEDGDSEMLLLEETADGGVETTEWLNAWLPFLNSGAMERILGGYQTMFQNACDQNAEALEWKPEIADALRKATPIVQPADAEVEA
jgi:hypothetical protein